MSLNLKMKGRYPQIVVGIERNSFLRRVEKEDIQMRCRMSVPRKTCRRLEFVRKNVWDLHRQDTKLNLIPSMWIFLLITEQTYSGEGCRISVRVSPQRSEGHCGQRFICSRDKWDICVEEKPFGTSREPTSIMIAIGKAESTDQSTVHVTDLDVFVIMIMLEVSFAVIILVSFVRGHGILLWIDKWRIRHKRDSFTVHCRSLET